MNSIKEQKDISVPSTTIIELREQNKSSQNKLDGSGTKIAGDYETVLNKTLYIEPNDQVEVASAFIDTASNSSGLIILDPDDAGGNTTTISLEFGYYMTNAPMSVETTKGGTVAENVRDFYGVLGNTADGTANTETDGERYVACHRIAHGGGVLSGSCVSIEVNFTEGIDPLKHNNNSLYELKFKSNYVDTGTGKVVTQRQQMIFRTISMELLKPFLTKNATSTMLVLDEDTVKKLVAVRDANGTTLVAQNTLSFPFHFTGGAANEPQDDGSIWGDHNNPSTGGPVPNNGFKDFFFDNKTVTAPNESRPLVTDTATITMPSGHYSAEEITTQISTLLTQATKDGAIGAEDYDVVNNPLLTNMRQLLRKNTGSIRFVRTDGLREFEFKTSLVDLTTRNFVVGTSQFGLNYDEGDMRVEISSQHSSLFNIDNVDQAGQPELRAYKTQPNSNGDTTKFYADSYSGIFILKMTPNKLWSDQFKFRDLVVTPKMKTVAYNPDTYTVPTFEGDNALIVGKNITSDMTGVDASIQKVFKKDGGNNVTQSYDIPFVFPVAPSFQGILVNDTTPILASGSINDGSHGEETLGYYQLEIDFGVPIDIQGKDENTNKIQSIVSRYYQSGSFTSAYNEGSFAYIHPPTAAPMAVNSFKVRILQPDNTIANDISTNNAIFLKIIKNNNNL